MNQYTGEVIGHFLVQAKAGVSVRIIYHPDAARVNAAINGSTYVRFELKEEGGTVTKQVKRRWPAFEHHPTPMYDPAQEAAKIHKELQEAELFEPMPMYCPKCDERENGPEAS